MKEKIFPWPKRRLLRCSGDIEENSLSITPIARSIPQVASGAGNDLLSHTCQACR
jgi:hypothetical protein